MKTVSYLLIYFLISVSQVQALPNLKFPTLGGMQFWDDVEISQGHRIQQHVWTKHYRTLDEDDWRIAWGNLADCQAKMPVSNFDKNVNKPLILLIHGLGRSRYSMSSLQKKLSEAGYEAQTVAYSSFLKPIDHFSANLKNILDKSQHREIYCVTHSLGGIVVRHLDQHHPSEKMKAAITLAAPHKGSAVVDTLSFCYLDFLLGPTGKGLGTKDFLLEEKSTSFPILTVAGVSNGISYLPFGIFLGQESDGIVKEKNSRLKYSKRHHKVNASHTFIMNDPKVLKIIQKLIVVNQ